MSFAQGVTGNFLTGGGDYPVSLGSELKFSVTADLSDSVDITGAGTVNFLSGILEINGIYDITGNTLFRGSTVNFNPASTLTALSSPNVLDISKGMVNFNSGHSPINLTSYTQTGGSVTGSDSINVNGLMIWNGGLMSGSGVTTAHGGIELGETTSKGLGRQLDLPMGQNANWTGGFIDFSDAGTFNNQGIFSVQVEGNSGMRNFGGVGIKTFNNQGSFFKEAISTGITTIQFPIVFNNDGDLFPGKIPGAGATTINNIFTQQSTGSLNIELGSLDNSQLIVGNNATLAGDLNVDLVNGFTPQVGDSFVIMTYGSKSGTFNNENLPAGFNWDVDVGVNDITLTVIP